jgi:L-rhamnose mutarotase
MSASTPQRHIRVVGLLPEKRAEYLRLHEVVWPDVEARLTASGITNYSIFLLGDRLISYYEYVGDDYEADMALIAADPTTQEWWTLTDPCQAPVPEAEEGQLWADATEVWHMS